MNLSNARSGERLSVNGKTISFGLWPTKDGGRGNAHQQSLLFSLDPWAIIDLSIKKNCNSASLPEALACMRQAKDFFDSATETGKVSAKPLSLYYCFMNLVKALCLTRGIQTTFDKAQHGLSEKLSASGRELLDAYLEAYQSPNARGVLQNFDEFLGAITGSKLAASKNFTLPELLPQIVPGHRLWSVASGKAERFIAAEDIHFMVDKSVKNIWLRMFFVADDLARLGVKHNKFLELSRLDSDFSQVKWTERNIHGKKLLCFEQVNPVACTGTKYANHLMQLVELVKGKLWSTVATVPPYRRYYAYLAPLGEHASILPQLLSIYAISYYFGSITRYRPHHLGNIESTDYGPRVQDFITGQPLQFLYLISSEFAKQDIARPSIV